MASLLIRNLDEALKQQLRLRAATHSRSMEEEARIILREGLVGRDGEGAPDLADLARDIFGPGGIGVELPLPERDDGREPPDFSA